MNPTALVVPLALAAVATMGTVATVQARPRAPVPLPAADSPPAPRVATEPWPVGPSASRVPVAAPGAQPRGRWVWPLTPRPRVAGPFVPPPSPYAAGHRGVDLEATRGQAVRAVDAGVVTHAGRVAGRVTVTVSHPSGVRSTYEPVTARVARGDAVARGEVVGTVAAGTSHCAPATCLHLGAVRGEVYLDPLRLLGGGRVRLLPLGQVPDG